LLRRKLLDGLAAPGAGTFLSMRRSRFDPLEPTVEPRWYTVRNMHGKLLEARRLPPGSDLKRAFVTGMLEWIDAGWQLGEFSSTGGTFFCTRGADRRMVSITPTSPDHVHRFVAAHLTESPGRED
jgi:hypothetical protein